MVEFKRSKLATCFITFIACLLLLHSPQTLRAQMPVADSPENSFQTSTPTPSPFPTSTTTTITTTTTNSTTTVPYSCNSLRCDDEVGQLGRQCNNCCPQGQAHLTRIPNTQWTGLGDERCAMNCQEMRLFVDGTPGSFLGFPGVCCPLGQMPLSIIPNTPHTGRGDIRCARECPNGESLYVDGSLGSYIGFPGVCCPLRQMPLTIIPNTPYTGSGDIRCARACDTSRGESLFVDGAPGSPIGFPGICCPSGTTWDGRECLPAQCVNAAYRLRFAEVCEMFPSSGHISCRVRGDSVDRWNGIYLNDISHYNQNVVYATGHMPTCFRNILQNNTIGLDFLGSSGSLVLLNLYSIYLESEWLASIQNPSLFYQPFYIDNNCRRVSYPGNICSEIGIRVNSTRFRSPISLIWQQNTNYKNIFAATQFQLNPEKSGLWYSWRASGETPLLAYDPDHLGQITSATQLFGNYTFGKVWKDGYDALATLDENSDGEVSGNELSDLVLWFDYNQDGVSDKGEVKSLSSVQVTALYYDSDRTDPETGDIHASRGYEKVIAGQKTILPSVDWFGIDAHSKMEVFARRALSSAEQISTAPKNATQAPELIKIDNHQPQTTLGKIAGTWFWTIDGDKPTANRPVHEGALLFDEAGEVLIGLSVLAIPVEPNDKGIATMITRFPLHGSKTLTTDGKTKLNFQVQSGAEEKTITEAFLSEDGQTLFGSTKEEVIETVGNKTKSVIAFEYKWTARRE